jgi:thiosulfate reductase cytochrome b subunit
MLRLIYFFFVAFFLVAFLGAAFLAAFFVAIVSVLPRYDIHFCNTLHCSYRRYRFMKFDCQEKSTHSQKKFKGISRLDGRVESECAAIELVEGCDAIMRDVY